MDDIGAITARISEIQDRIASLSGPAQSPSPPLSPQAGQSETAGPTFAQALDSAKASPAPLPSIAGVSLPPIHGSTLLPDGPSGVLAPPASLGPLPTLPVSPGAANVVPIPRSASGTDGLIEKYAAQNGLSPALVRAVIKVESDGNPRCVSSAGAMGLMQLMPDNVKEAGISDPFDPEQNVMAGTKQLGGLLKQYGGNLDLALAGYNAGPGNVRKYGGIPPFTETQNYVKRVRAAMEKE